MPEMLTEKSPALAVYQGKSIETIESAMVASATFRCAVVTNYLQTIID